ncbi:MAG: hypothetical protein AAGH57_02955 [Pseudomonadota bacterium]
MLRTMLFPALIAIALAPASAANQPDDKAIRNLQKELVKLEGRYNKLLKRCQGDEYNRADARACDTARVTYQEVQQLKKQIAALSVD